MNFDHILSGFDVETVVRLLIALALGAAVGFERQLKKKTSWSSNAHVGMPGVCNVYYNWALT